MQINFEQAQGILEFVDRTSRMFCVPRYIMYNYISLKAGKNGCTILEQIDKINENIETNSTKNSLKRKAIHNKILLREKLHKYWKKLVEEVKEERAVENYQKFKNCYSHLKVYGQSAEIN